MSAPDDLLAERYRLIKRVGSGATGEVWRARDERLARDIAIKIVDLSAQHDAPGAVARFRRETNTSAKLNSPYVVGVYDAGSDGDLAFIVMELLTGPSLKDLVEQEGPLEFPSGLLIAAQAAQGLADAHATGVVHRDLKPGNIVLSGGVPKIVDFGIARLADPGDATQTSTATVAGTAAYMSPEQATGQRVTTASDLYSFGCLLMAIFTGASPFAGRGPIEQATAQVHELPPTLLERRPEAPQALSVLVSQLLSKDPRERPDAATTAAELRSIRTALLRGQQPTRPVPPITALAAAPVGALPRSQPTPRSQRTPRSQPTPSDAPVLAPMAAAAMPARRGAAWPWIVTGLVACATIAVGWLNLDRAEPQPTVAPTTITTTSTATPLATPTLRLPSVSARTSETRATPGRTPSTSARPGDEGDGDETPATKSKAPKPSEKASKSTSSDAPSATPEPSDATSAEPAPEPEASAAPSETPTKPAP